MSTRLRIWHNGHSFPEWRVNHLIAFVVEHSPTINNGLAVRVRAPHPSAHPSGYAHFGQLQWARRLHCRWAISLRPSPLDFREFGIPQVCWHSTETKRRKWTEDGLQVTVAEALADGKTHVGRWPIYTVGNWEESLLQLFAHELSHIIQEQRWRGASARNGMTRQSEVLCEEFALQRLQMWQNRPNRERGVTCPS